MDQVHGLPRATREDVWDEKDFERIPEKLDEDRDIISPFVKIDEEKIQHFSHDHHLRFQGCDHENKFCQACCLHLISTERFYGCVQCDFVLHEACACLTKNNIHYTSTYLPSSPPFPSQTQV